MTSKTQPVLWKPNPGPQTKFLSSGAYEVLYGGAAGAGKSIGLLMAPTRYIGAPSFRALLLRRTFPELEKSLIELSHQYYPALAPGARYHDQRKCWSFPSGAKIWFGHLEHEKDVHSHQSAEYQFIGFDELTSFTEKQYTYLLSRARSSKGIPIRIRAGTNPGNIGHEWVLRRWGPWLNPGDAPVQAEPGQVLWCREGQSDSVEWFAHGETGALSRQFIPGRLSDNPHLLDNDPDYIYRLDSLDPVERARLRDGNWLVAPAAGMYFKRSWVTFVSQAPVLARRVRYWDFAATKKTKNSRDPDWTVGVRLALTNLGQHFVEDVVRFRGDPREVERQLVTTAELDGPSVMVGLERDPGQAGKYQTDQFIRLLNGHHVRVFAPISDKIQRFGPFSSQASGGNVQIVRGPWNEAYVRELEAFPDGAHDDQVDATSGAHMALSGASSTGARSGKQHLTLIHGTGGY
jgi:predicted phage terminase large subunit-like protein